jgi:glycosyltransferase involved in cell wall biosynthesis
VTIIITNFNKAIYIRRSLSSAVGQTAENIEVIVADDGSSDGSVNIVKDFIALDSRVSYFVNSPRILTNANRARAVRRAQGAFILMLDSDDELVNRTAEVDYLAAVTTGADIVEHRVQMVKDNKTMPFTALNAPFAVADGQKLMTAFAKGRMNWTLWRKLIRRVLYLKALEKMGAAACALKVRLCDDRLQCGAIFTVVRKFVFIDYVGYIYYYQLPSSATLSVSVEEEAELVDAVLRRFYPRLASCVPASPTPRPLLR